ncbi:Hypothetical Protein MfeM64YM_0495 [Mycoplasmopsis fermentans M64]|uniref:Uncharacterized protein n=1 Tax=Mycoplasmopsis fermentans (strain M64) TaxID=943945 RepID=A0AB32XBS2_MYCFM|nr:Hypothetical Protein MfeM64YM_0495 [Mycoplasmopsis fermentans M64]
MFSLPIALDNVLRAASWDSGPPFEAQ